MPQHPSMFDTRRGRVVRNTAIGAGVVFLVFRVMTNDGAQAPAQAEQVGQVTLDQVGVVEQDRVLPAVSDPLRNTASEAGVTEISIDGSNQEVVTAAQQTAVRWGTYEWATLPTQWAAKIPNVTTTLRARLATEASASWPRIREARVEVRARPGQAAPQILSISGRAAKVAVPLAQTGRMNGAEIPAMSAMVTLDLAIDRSSGKWLVTTLSSQ